VSHVEFLIDRNGGSLKVDVFADEEEAAYKTNVLLLPSNETTKAREWITMIVDNEADFHTFKLKQESPAVQLRLTSMRIHCKKGGYTSG
jgi:CYTH domain-containing protein